MDLKELLIKHGLEYRFSGCAPEGFVLVHEKTLDDLKDFDIWKQWKNDEITIQEINRLHFDSD